MCIQFPLVLLLLFFQSIAKILFWWIVGSKIKLAEIEISFPLKTIWFSTFKIKLLLFNSLLKSLPPKIKILFLSIVIAQDVSHLIQLKPGSFGLNIIHPSFIFLIFKNSILSIHELLSLPFITYK